jgi:hypothetical protein
MPERCGEVRAAQLQELKSAVAKQEPTIAQRKEKIDSYR